MKTYSGNITELKDNEVFIFGSNLSGFHGAGAAGFASFNESGNVWRKYNYDKLANGWRGRWNIKGVGWGYQEGTHGASYAIPTVKRAGEKRSLTLEQIRKHIEVFHSFACGMRHKTFYVAQGYAINLNGHSTDELRSIWFDNLIWPNNVYFNEEFVLTE